MTKVFISSTGKDLEKYRQAAIDECNRLGMTPIAIEFFEAMGVGAVEGSKKKLDEAELYVGIFAHRYGYIEDGFDKSVTEIEFDYAGKRGLERLCFLVDHKFNWPPDTIDYQNHQQLQAFKDRVEKGVIRKNFTTVDDFSLKLHRALAARRERNPEPKPTPPQKADTGTSTISDPLSEDLYPLLCHVVDYTNQCTQVDRYFFPPDKQDKASKDRGIFLIEGTNNKHRPDALVDHLAIRQRPNNYDAFKSKENIGNLLDRTKIMLTGTFKEESHFAYELFHQKFPEGEFDTLQERVGSWLNNGEKKYGRKVIYVPLDVGIRDRELTDVLNGAKQFIDGLRIAEGRALLVLFGCQRKGFLPSAPWMRKKRLKAITEAGDSQLLDPPTKLTQAHVIDEWIPRLPSDLFYLTQIQKLKTSCRKQFPPRKEWYYEDLYEDLKEVLARLHLRPTGHDPELVHRS
uniref:DUF4062 domain-containing protein n=1 Tax=Candidatus Kentrum sp. TUN TaxID=2126343 RepID=A0A450ZT95_9GAMM|nr:MAG: protein of unknown function (DUF4062) [Candidatus Kentron sp. TUN]